MEMLGAYQIAKPLSGKNSGYCVWGFGYREGEEYFIKEFLSPKYPAADTQASPERIARKREKCRAFEQEKTKLYQVINEHADGNVVRVEELFRVGAKYYTASRKVESLNLRMQDVFSFREGQRRRLCAIIAHSVASIHSGGVVHADLKHENILFCHTAAGTMTAKLIDFDSSFLEADAPKPGQEIVGDQVYFSPEAYRSMAGEPVPLKCAMDVFSMGILFHQYLTGWLPGYDSKRFGYAGEAVAAGDKLRLASAFPKDLARLFEQMFSADPLQRPTAAQVFEALGGRPFCRLSPEKSRGRAPLENPWAMPGDL